MVKEIKDLHEKAGQQQADLKATWKAIQARVKQLRKDGKVSQQKVAELLDYSQDWVSRVDRWDSKGDHLTPHTAAEANRGGGAGRGDEPAYQVEQATKRLAKARTLVAESEEPPSAKEVKQLRQWVTEMRKELNALAKLVDKEGAAA
ncbi:MAG: hypothetical protein ACREMY_02160 [bacterium]